MLIRKHELLGVSESTKWVQPQNTKTNFTFQGGFNKQKGILYKRVCFTHSSLFDSLLISPFLATRVSENSAFKEAFLLSNS